MFKHQHIQVMNTKSFLAVCMLTLLGFAAHAQEFSLGPAVAYQRTWAADNNNRTDGFNGVSAGLKWNYSSISSWGIGGAFNYSMEGFNQNIEGLNSRTTLHYMRIPVQVNYFFGEFGDDFRPKIYAGPTLGIMGKATNELRDIKTTVTDNYDPFDVALTVGTGFNYRVAPATWLNFDVAYNHGLMNIPANGLTLRNRGVSAGAGILFGF